MVACANARFGRQPCWRACRTWWDLQVPTAPLIFVDGWGLPPDDLARLRVSVTGRDQALAALRLG